MIIDKVKDGLYTQEQVEDAVRIAISHLLASNLDNDIPQSNSPTQNEREALTVSQAAEIIGISMPKMYEIVRAKKVRSVRVGKKIIISRQSLFDWLRGGE